jgi:hypothetical protein
MYGTALDTGGAPLVAWTRYWDAFWALPASVRAGVVVGVTVALAVMLVGLFPEYGQRGAEKARRHSLTSTFIGTVVAGLFVGSVGALYYGATRNETVSMLAMPVLFVLAVIAVVWIGIGLVAVGEFVAARIGHDDAAWGTVVAAVLVGAGAVYPAFGAAVLVVAVLLGFGAGIRTNPFATERERVVPPDRKA